MLWTVGAGLAWFVGQAAGQADRGAATEPVGPAEVGQVLARTALIDLGMRESPRPDDYEIAASALWVASNLRPDDTETARLLSAAAWAAGDRDLLLDATRRVIRNDPADTVAQLRLVSANINERQTVADRLDAYARFLGPAGRSLDASIRSRLALDAALLLREQGDTAAFEQRLREAVELDPTNKDAVSLGARTFLSDASPAREIAAWQIRLLYADPLDPHVHLTIGRIAAAQGDLDSAQRFMDNAAGLMMMALGDVPLPVRQQQLALQWQRRGADSVLASLNPPLRVMRESAEERIRLRQEAGEPTSDLRRPEEIRYDLGIDQIRLLAAYTLSDEETVESTLFDMGMTSAQTLQAISEGFSDPSADRSALLFEMVRVFSDYQIARAIVQRDADLIRRQSREYFGEVPAAMELLAPLDAWVAYAEKDYALALDLVGEPRPGTNDDLLFALASERVGEKEAAAPILLKYARQQSLSGYGALARARLKAMGREAEIVTESGTQLRGALARVPGWMDRMTSEPRTFMLLQAEAAEDTVGPLERAQVRVRLRNTAPIPLGVGSSRPIGSRMLIAPRPVSRLADFAGAPTPKVLEMDQRLRLEPLSEIEVVVPADSPYTSWLREANAQVSLRDRYRVIQSFQPGPKGGLINAPHALVAESPIVQRRTLDLARAEPAEIARVIAGDTPADLRAALVATLSRVIQPLAGLELTAADQRTLADAWADRFEDATPEERALMLLKLPHAGQSPAFESFDRMAQEVLVAEGVSRARTDPALLLATLLTRVRDADSAVFELAGQSEDERVRGLGLRLAERLRAGRRSFATAGPGVGGLAPPGGGVEASLTTSPGP
jgi:tetratricopeptide (TPR) repeat protein